VGKVKCEICGKVMTAEEAGKHKEELGHNSWTLIKGDADAKRE